MGFGAHDCNSDTGALPAAGFVAQQPVNFLLGVRRCQRTEHYSLGSLIAVPAAGLIAPKTNSWEEANVRARQNPWLFSCFLAVPGGGGPQRRGADRANGCGLGDGSLMAEAAWETFRILVYSRISCFQSSIS